MYFKAKTTPATYKKDESRMHMESTWGIDVEVMSADLYTNSIRYRTN